MPTETCFIWNEGEVVWNTTEFLWTTVCEVEAEIVERPVRGAFIDHRKKRYTHRWTLDRDAVRDGEEKPNLVRIVVVIGDRRFEESKYVGKRISVDAFDGELVVKSVKRLNVSAESVSLKPVKLDELTETISVSVDEIKTLNGRFERF